MPQNSHVEAFSDEDQQQALHPAASTGAAVSEFYRLRQSGSELARNLPWQPNVHSSGWIVKQRHELDVTLRPLLATLHAPVPKASASDDFHWLHDNVRLLYSELQATADAVKPLSKIPHAYTSNGESIPRAAGVAEEFLLAAGFKFSEPAFNAYVQGFQETTVLDVKELWALVSCLKIILLKEIASLGQRVLADTESVHGVAVCIRSLRDIAETS